jgi:cytochrome d ubiquinol oxidase subunit II
VSPADWLPLAFAALAALSVLAYVLMDGWDLGVGILYPLVARDADRQLMLESIAPFWDANETWLVFGGMMLLAGFPLAYATLLPVLYMPVILMLLALVLRGISYEFRHHGTELRPFWEWLFFCGSILMALAQGWMLGRIVEGVPDPAAIEAQHGWLRGLFPPICAVGMVGGYALLGACWLILKASGALQVFAREVAHSALLLTLALLGAVCIWTPITVPQVAHRWFRPSVLSLFWVLPLVSAVVAWRLWKSLWGDQDARPLSYAVSLFVLAFIGLGVSIYPYIVPYRYTIFEAANDAVSLRFTAVGVAAILPIIATYLVLGYRVFRGKVVPHQAEVAAGPHIGARRSSGNPADLHLS